MSSPGELVQLLLVVVPFIVSPGPGNLMCATTGARFGPNRSLGFIVGLELMVFVPAFAVGIGLGTLLEAAGDLLDWLQVAGSIFILWLAYRLLRDPIGGADDAGGVGPMTRSPSFVDGVVLQALNIKGAVVLLVIFTEFGDRGNQIVTAAQIAAVITCVSLLGHLAWLRGGAWLAHRYSSPTARRVQGLVYAASLATVAIWLLVS